MVLFRLLIVYFDAYTEFFLGQVYLVKTRGRNETTSMLVVPDGNMKQNLMLVAVWTE